MNRAGANASIWMSGPLEFVFPSLNDDICAEVAVVGGGITGLTAAMQLLESGRSVVLLEMNCIGSGTTGSSTGHLDGYTDRTIRGLVRTLGEEAARTVLRLKRDAIDHVETWSHELEVDCRFSRIPAYLYCEDEAKVEWIKDEYQAARTLGIPVDMQRNAPLPFQTELCLMFPDQARFDPLRYVRGLATAFRRAGGTLFENTRAEKIWEEGGAVKIETDKGSVTANSVVLAGHAPLLGMFTVEPRAVPYQSYVVGVRVMNSVPDALYWDTDSPYHYTRQAGQDDPHFLVIGGADHRTGAQVDTVERFRELERYVRNHYRVESVTSHWSHEFFETADGVPYIGKVPKFERIYMGAGFSGDGLTFGTMAGVITSDLVLGRESPAAGIFDPARLNPLSSVRRLTGNLLHMARHFVADRLMGADFDSVDQIAPGQGGLVVIEGERLAVFRDEHGEVHMMSPVCRHMGCFVRFNAAEQTWDCPCHGGRYEARGQVIMGPPKQPLEQRTPAPAEAP